MYRPKQSAFLIKRKEQGSAGNKAYKLKEPWKREQLEDDQTDQHPLRQKTRAYNFSCDKNRGTVSL